MKNFNLELIKKGAEDKATKLIMQRNGEIISLIKQFIPYKDYDKFQELLDNYEKLINKYLKYTYLLGFTRAVYENE